MADEQNRSDARPDEGHLADDEAGKGTRQRTDSPQSGKGKDDPSEAPESGDKKATG